jgi:hypothetical protein
MSGIKSIVLNTLGKYLLFPLKDALAMQYLMPLSQSYLPWTGYSIRPSGLVKIINEIIINQRTQILECGGGISTIYIARLLKDRGGRLYSIENDARWAGIIKNILEAEGLAEFVSIIVAPLAQSQFGLDGNYWYDEAIVKNAIADTKVDLLIVDGPTATTEATSSARYPAVPFFRSYFASDYAVVLDDIIRSGEQEIVSKWEKELKITFRNYAIDGGIAVGHAKYKYTI